MRKRKKLAAFLGVATGIALFLAPIAAAHSVAITASLDCNGNLSYTVTDWATSGSGAVNPEIDITAGGQTASGAFTNTPANHTISGTFSGISGSSVTVTATAIKPWGDGVAGGQTASTTATRPTDCQVTPTITTSLQPSSITAGSSAYDKATLSGLSNASGGTVAFTVYSSSNCSTGATSAGTAAVSGSGTVSVFSDAVEFDTAGTYYWKAVYSGDTNNKTVASACTAEVLTVTTPTTSTITTTTTVPTTTTVNTTTTVPTTVTTTTTNTNTVTVPQTNTVTVTVPSTTTVTIPSTTTVTVPKTVTVTVPKTVTVVKKVTQPFTPPTLPAKISIAKNPKSQSIAAGGTATFQITVTNTGKATLTDVSVSDPKTAACVKDLGTLAPGSSKSYSCELANAEKDFTNIACVSGKPPTGANVSDCDSANVKVAAFKPAKVKAVHHVVKKAAPKPKPKPKLVAHGLPKNTG